MFQLMHPNGRNFYELKVKLLSLDEHSSPRNAVRITFFVPHECSDTFRTRSRRSRCSPNAPSALRPGSNVIGCVRERAPHFGTALPGSNQQPIVMVTSLSQRIGQSS